MTRRFSPRGPFGQVPPLLRYYQRATTSCRPSRRTSFPSLGNTTGTLAFRSRHGRVLPRRAWGWSPGSPGRDFFHGDDRISHVPGEPQLHLCPALRPRQDRRVRPLQHADAAPALTTTKAPTLPLSGLNHTASALAVYASQGGSPHHHARLASGCRPGSTGRA